MAMSGARFRYRGATFGGEVVRGQLAAASREEAHERLLSQGVVPLRLSKAPSSLLSRRGASRQDLAILFRTVASLTASGIPVERALGASEELVPERLRAVVRGVRERIRKGDGVAEAMAGHADVFPRIVTGLVSAGERASQLSESLARAAEQLEQEARLRSELQSALAYPLLVLVVGLASVAVMGTVVIPRFAELLASLGADLPASTRLLVAVSDAGRRFGLPAFIVVLGAGLALARALQRPSARRQVDRLLLRLPLVRGVRHGFASSRVCRSLGAMLSTGMPLLSALEAAEEGTGDREIAARLRDVRTAVAQGEKLSTSLAANQALVPLALQFVGAGEGSGDLGLMLTRGGEVVQERTHRSLQALIRLLEPALVIGLGLLVALTAAALLQAVYSVRPGV